MSLNLHIPYHLIHTKLPAWVDIFIHLFINIYLSEFTKPFALEIENFWKCFKINRKLSIQKVRPRDRQIGILLSDLKVTPSLFSPPEGAETT